MGKKSILAILLSASLMLSPAMQLFSVAAESNGATDIATISGGDLGQDDVGGGAENSGQTGTKEKISLPVPTGVEWGENWTPTWSHVKEADGWYWFEVYKDGELFRMGQGRFCDPDGNINYEEKVSSVYFARYITESGTYALRVKSCADVSWADYHSETYMDSEWSELVTREYVCPEKELGEVTSVYWDDENIGTFYWYGVAGARGYHREYFFTPNGSEEEQSIGEAWSIDLKKPDVVSEIHYDNIAGNIEYHGAGKYRVKITALSGNIDEIQHAKTGGFSPYYDTTQTAEAVSGLLGDAISNSDTKREALEKIKENINRSALRTAMQTDSTVLDQIKELESGYIAEQGITVEAPSVSTEAAVYVNASNISVVGAGLNASADNKVTLEVSVPEKKEDVSSKYYTDNSVQLDISLKRDGESVHELEIPITITMPVPTGIDLSHLVILHYHEDGTFETVNLKNNGDGTITFTVDRFSTFVFAETVSEDAATPDEPKDTDTGTGSTNTDAGSTEQDNTNNKNNTVASSAISPKTGESIDVLQILSYVIIVLATGLGVFHVWKEKENE